MYSVDRFFVSSSSENTYTRGHRAILSDFRPSSQSTIYILESKVGMDSGKYQLQRRSYSAAGEEHFFKLPSDR
jgi:hypothetical protein